MVSSSTRFLSEEFLKRYRNIQPRNKGILFEVLFLRSYSRYLPELKRRETWLEAVQRVTEYSVGLYQGPASFQDLVEEAEFMFDKVFHLEVLPSGRSLWIGGTEAVNKHQESAFNCAALVISKLEDFCDTFHLLMCGCGVGYRVLKDDVNKLPLLNVKFSIKHEEYNPVHPASRLEDTEVVSIEEEHGLTCQVGCNSKSKYQYSITIGDSRKAWVESLRQFLKILTSNKNAEIIFNYDSIRPAGERIKTSGGIAPGPNGMRDMFNSLERLIKKAEGVITPVVAMDMLNTISLNVIVGGTRRSALIALGDPSDQEFIEAKKDLYQVIDGKWIKNEDKASRIMSNNSVVYTEKPTKEEIKRIFSNIKYNGEPGFFNLQGARERRPNANSANPCLEILLDSYGMCLTKDTKILTSEGNISIIDCDNKMVYVPFDSDLSLVRKDRFIKAKLLNKGKKEVYNINLFGKTSIKATKDHLFLTKDINKVYSWKRVEDLRPGDRVVTPVTKHLPGFDINYLDHELETETVGWMIGDGWCSQGNKIVYGACFGPSEQLAKDKVSKQFNIWWNSNLGIKKDYHKTSPKIYVQSNGVGILNIAKYNVLKYLSETFGLNPTKGPKKDLSKQIKMMSPNKIGSILSGLFSADGSVSFDKTKNTFGIHLSSSSLPLLKSTKECLKLFGVSCSICFNELRTRPGRSQGSITIKGNTNITNFAKRINFSMCPEKQEKLKKATEHISIRDRIVETTIIESIDFIGEEEVFDLSVPEAHHFIANGIVVHNCNLSTVVLPSHITEDNRIDIEKLRQSVKLATRIGLRQTNVSLSLPHWDFIQKRDRLTGVSMTGLMDTFDRVGESYSIVEHMRKFAHEEATAYSYEMRVPTPLLVTAIKPEGSLSLLPTVSPGLHRSYAPYYIRRIRVSELDPVCKALDKLGVPNEKDVTKKDSSRRVFSFPIKSGAKIKANDESAISQFSRYLKLQEFYTDHNSSCTLTVGKNEWEEIIEAVDTNWNSLIACAFLPKDHSAYPQMPLEEISEEKYNELSQDFPDLSKLHELVNMFENGFDEEPDLIDCSTGSCPVR